MADRRFMFRPSRCLKQLQRAVTDGLASHPVAAKPDAVDNRLQPFRHNLSGLR